MLSVSEKLVGRRESKAVGFFHFDHQMYNGFSGLEQPNIPNFSPSHSLYLSKKKIGQINFFTHFSLLSLFTTDLI